MVNADSVKSLKSLRMSNQAQALAHLEEYARNIKEKVYDVDAPGDEQAYEARLKKTLAHLKDQVHQEQNILQMVEIFIHDSITYFMGI